MKLKNIIFDFDGVLFQSQFYHLNRLKELFDLNLSMSEYSDSHFGDSYFNQRDKNNIFQKVDWDIYNSEIPKDFPLLKMEKDIKSGLKKLAKKYRLFIISSGFNEHIEKFLENNEVKDLFLRRLYLTDHPQKIPKFEMLEKEFNISPEDSIFVTDTVGDVMDAREKKYPVITVAYGLHQRIDFEKVGVENIVDSFRELVEKIEK